jgi:hypothetical protein
MRHLFTFLSLCAFTFAVQANELAIQYDQAIKDLNNQVATAYDNANLHMSNTEMLDQLNQIQSSFQNYTEVATEIKARFKNQDIQLYADLADLNPKYCRIEAEKDNTLTFLGLVDPALAPLALLDDAEIVFKLKNFGDLMDFNRQLSREEYRIKMEKGKTKRYIRKLRSLKEELTF